MKQFLIVSTFIFTALLSYSQTFKKQSDETADQFIKRITQLHELPHPVIETKEWNSAEKVIIYFIPDKEENVLGYLLVPTSNLTYQQVLIDTFHVEGVQARIEAVFFANADKDKEREIIVLTSWEQEHVDVSGTLYGTFIYDAPTLVPSQKRLTFCKVLSKKFDGGFEGNTEGTQVKAKYKTVASIRAGLKQMGY